jgi:hypothetical protein
MGMGGSLTKASWESGEVSKLMTNPLHDQALISKSILSQIQEKEKQESRRRSSVSLDPNRSTGTVVLMEFTQLFRRELISFPSPPPWKAEITWKLDWAGERAG